MASSEMPRTRELRIKVNLSRSRLHKMKERVTSVFRVDGGYMFLRNLPIRLRAVTTQNITIGILTAPKTSNLTQLRKSLFKVFSE